MLFNKNNNKNLPEIYFSKSVIETTNLTSNTLLLLTNNKKK